MTVMWVGAVGPVAEPVSGTVLSLPTTPMTSGQSRPLALGQCWRTGVKLTQPARRKSGKRAHSIQVYAGGWDPAKLSMMSCLAASSASSLPASASRSPASTTKSAGRHERALVAADHREHRRAGDRAQVDAREIAADDRARLRRRAWAPDCRDPAAPSAADRDRSSAPACGSAWSAWRRRSRRRRARDHAGSSCGARTRSRARRAPRAPAEADQGGRNGCVTREERQADDHHDRELQRDDQHAARRAPRSRPCRRRSSAARASASARPRNCAQRTMPTRTARSRAPSPTRGDPRACTAAGCPRAIASDVCAPSSAAASSRRRRRPVTTAASKASSLRDAADAPPPSVRRRRRRAAPRASVRRAPRRSAAAAGSLRSTSARPPRPRRG